MALLWIDGFDHYTTTNSASLPALATGIYTWTTSGSNTYSTSGKNSGCLSYSGATSSSGGFSLPISNTNAIVGVGMHFNYTSFDADNTYVIAKFQNNTTEIVTVYLSTGGTIRLRIGSTTLATSTDTLTANTWYFIEIKFNLVGGSSSTIEVRVNGATYVSYTGNLGSSVANTLAFFQKGGIATHYTGFADDLFIWNGDGSTNNDWLGEQNVYTLMPSGDTTQADWSLSTGSNGYDLINNRPASDTSYIEADTVNDQSDFDFDDTDDTNIKVLGVQTVARSLKTGTDPVTFAIGLNSHLGSDQSPVQNTSDWFFSIQETNPDTSTDWTATDINAAVLSVKRTA